MYELKEAAKDEFANVARQYGLKLVRSGNHNVWRHPDNPRVQIASPRTTSDFRAIQNFTSELKSRLRQAGILQSSPVTRSASRPTQSQPRPTQPQLSSAQRRELGGTRVPPEQRGTTFAQFQARANAARGSQTNTTPQTNTAQRLSTAWLRNLKNLSATDLVKYGNKALSQVTGAAARGLHYVPNKDTPVPSIASGNILDIRTVDPPGTSITDPYGTNQRARDRATRQFGGV